ncbi:MAG: ChaN family lipoprotein [Alphaproteobacteria bacterium]|jgi:uncharacterized iron-regulated protein|nr:ChaN family lipoprotein [Alphaproteobacteria bacterium]MDP6589767.1 ChaN family lipoprotein [Alphaproteobacteria bacterium]MDP6818396.1 ChaN family lipoprotein [Alphaproteobacteria bacterium]|tara:strand:+ start:1122 stop:2096 length:975 start_codon:yes stop_codon:yes gene_type:complete
MSDKRSFASLLATLIMLGACAAPSPWQAEHYRDHPLVGRIWISAEARFIERAELIAALAPAAFILLGETHDNPDHHLLQAEIVTALAATGRRPVLAFEMLDMTQSEALGEHLAQSPNDAAGIGEAAGWGKSGWPDWAIYRPVAVAGLRAGLELRAASMSRAESHGLAQTGLAGAAPEHIQRLQLDRPLPAGDEEKLRREIDAAHCGYAVEEMIDAMAFAQFARDAHMAREMSSAGADGAILIAGNGHARNDRAVPFHLERMAPGRTVASLAFLEVLEGEEEAPAYAASFNGEVLPFDYVWFTPRVDIRDACERFEEQLKKMRKE